MPYYHTIEEDLKRAREILAKGRGEHAKEVEQLLRGTGGDRENQLLGSGGAIYGGDTYAAYKLLESFVEYIEATRERITKLTQLLDLLKELEPHV